MTDPIKNRREHVRIYRNYIVSYHLKGKRDVKYDMSQVNNISRGGINFTAIVPFTIGTELGIELKTPFINDKVLLEGTVLEAKEKVQGMLYEIRIQFHDISPDAENVLTKIEQYAAKSK